jgi:hypothetical protein
LAVDQITRVAEDANGRPRTTFEEIVVGESLGTMKWSVTRPDVEGLVMSDLEFDPWYESIESGGGGVVPPLATYPPVRVLFTLKYNIRGVFYEFESEFLRPIPYGLELSIHGVVADKWIKRNHEFVKYAAYAEDEAGLVYFRTARTHALDFQTIDVPKAGKGIDSGIVS